MTPLKTNIDTQNDAMFEAGDTFSKPSFLVSMLDFGGVLFLGLLFSIRIESSRKTQGKTYYINTPATDGDQQGLIEVYYNKDSPWGKTMLTTKNLAMGFFVCNVILISWRIFNVIYFYQSNQIGHIISYQCLLSIGVFCGILSKQVGAYNPT